ncbi:Rpn family recombination-promoting nuclease/putative transposase [Alkalinema pantanalense CENA528]|uniref:Rpn family recombination-promoting nuclease/putative transposase n=1 Tax=Alkalinema pantanalense TaxID=1620705 RepID=UPI003D6E77D7
MTNPKNQAKKSQETDYDNPWKSVIEVYFRDFLRFFFPTIETDVDWSKPIVFLDKELQKVVRDAEVPKRYADKLVQVYRVNGEPALVICHIEVQGQWEGNFAARMYSYNYRLRDRYDCPVVSLVILADESETWRPQQFQDELWGCATDFRFPIVKLLDYQVDWNTLAAIRNPFAVVTMAHLKTKETHNQPQARKTWRYRLTTMLYDQGYGEQDILELHNFLDWLMKLPEVLEKQFQSELKAFEEARQMKYVTTIERMAEERAKLEEKQEIALKMLRKNISLETIAEITELTIEQLQQLQADNQEV